MEISPGIGLADGIFDIVSSGSTLVSNNLREVEIVTHSEALLVGNWNLDDEKHQILNEMLFRFSAVRSAQDKKYVMMNAPKVLDEKRFWSIIAKLKDLGAQGILVTPIEKMIL